MKNDFILLERLQVLQQKLLSTKVPNRKKIIKEESLKIIDISGESNFKSKPFSPKYFLLHHTAGRGNPSQVVKILNCRRKNNSSKCTTLGIQWIIDRNGKLYQALPKGSKGAHVAYQKSGMGHITNSTAEGVEIIGNDDNDITTKQCKTALLLIKNLGYSLSNVFGHGEVSTNKQATEGQKCKTYATKYWNTPEDELPEVDDKDDKDDKDSKDSKDKKDNVTTTATTSKSSTNDNNDNDDDNDDNNGNLTTTTITTSTPEEKINPFDFFKRMGGILKESEELKIQEDLQRIKNLMK